MTHKRLPWAYNHKLEFKTSTALCVHSSAYSQQPRQEDELNIHQQVSGQTRRGACMQLDTIQPEE